MSSPTNPRTNGRTIETSSIPADPAHLKETVA